MEKERKLPRQFFDWMGVLLAVSLFALSALGGSADAQAGAVPARTDGGAVPLVVVDAGHGGRDGGAVGVDTGIKEAGINLAVARLVESGLREAGFEVLMTRTGPDALGSDKRADMQKRRELMRTDGVSAVVSIHMNKFGDRSIKGPMAFYMKGSAEGEALSSTVIAAVCERIGNPKRPANPGDYFVLRESVAPAVIIECGFLSNPTDEVRLQESEYQKLLAEGIVAGVAAYFAVNPAPGVKATTTG